MATKKSDTSSKVTLSKAFAAAQSTLVGIELMHTIKQRQLRLEEREEGLAAAVLFYSLAV